MSARDDGSEHAFRARKSYSVDYLIDIGGKL